MSSESVSVCPSWLVEDKRRAELATWGFRTREVESELSAWHRLVSGLGNYVGTADDYRNELAVRARLEGYVSTCSDLGLTELRTWVLGELDSSDETFRERTSRELQSSSDLSWYELRVPIDSSLDADYRAWLSEHESFRPAESLQPARSAEERIEATFRRGLKRLDLSGMDLVDIPPTIFRCTHLKVLDLRGNRIERASHELSELTRLEALFLRGNRLKQVPQELIEHNSLRVLDLGLNPFSARNVVDLNYSAGVERLLLADTDVSVAKIRALAENLKEIDLRFCSVAGDLEGLVTAGQKSGLVVLR